MNAENEAEEIKRDYKEWENRRAELERKIDRISSRDLHALKRAGADRKRLVRLLALTAMSDGSEYWKKAIRERRDELVSFAKRIDTLSGEAKKLATDVTYRSQFHFWWFAKGSVLGMREPTPLSDVPGVGITISGMRVLAKTYRHEAKRMSDLLRHYGQTDSGLVHLLLCVYLWTGGSAPLQYDHLARLLTDAFEAAGKTGEFSGDQLRKIWSRHGRRMLAVWKQIRTPPIPNKPTTSPTIGTPVSPLPTSLKR